MEWSLFVRHSSQFSNFIMRCMHCRGFLCLANYLDDFLCIGTNLEDCQLAQQVLTILLQFLGFQVAWHKCSSPAHITRYLGIDFDLLEMQLRLPMDKLQKLANDLDFFSRRTRAMIKQLQRLCGTLSHCAKVVQGWGGSYLFPENNLIAKAEP